MRNLGRAPIVTAIATTGVLVAFAGRYGWHRDELYFRVCGRRLAWGYVDQPPFTPAVARLSHEVFGDSLVGLRLFPALAIGVSVLLAAAIAREVGGDRRAQAIAAIVTATSPLFLGMGHLVSTATFDVLMWTVVLFLLVRLLRTGNTRWWPVVGLAVGAAFLNKHAVVFLVASLVIGFVLTPARRLLVTPWLLAGVVIAVAIAMPNVMWHASREWPVLDMIRSLGAESGFEDHVLFIPAQLQTGPAIVVWVIGLWWLLRRPDGVQFRPLGLAYLALVAVFVVAGAKPYYIAGVYPTLIAAGAVGWSKVRRPRVRSAPIAAIAIAGVVFALALALPAPPLSWQRQHPIEDLEMEVGAQLGWREMVDVIAEEVAQLDANDRRSVAIYTQNYGEAGAVDRYGPARGLPAAASPHNNYWWWGPPEDSLVTVVIGVPDEWIADLQFGRCERVHVLSASHGVQSEETGRSIHMCRDHRSRWAALWHDLRFVA